MVGIGHFTDKNNGGNGGIGNCCKEAGHAHNAKGAGIGHQARCHNVESLANCTAHGTADHDGGAENPAASAGTNGKRGGGLC